MTSPTTPEPDKRTVQDLEPSAKPRGPTDVPARPGPTTPAVPGGGDADDPSPPTTPIYLRPASRAESVVAPPAFDARKQTLTAQSAAIVDSITVGLADALAVSLRPVVASTIEALIPMILSLGSVPHGPGSGEDDVAARAEDSPATA